MGVGYSYVGVKMLLLNRSDASPPGTFPLLTLHHRPRSRRPRRPTGPSALPQTPLSSIAITFASLKLRPTSPPDCKSKLSGVVNFVTGSLRPIRSDVDESLSAWYKANSRVYVADDHACWHDPKSESKLRKKRFGAVLRSPEVTLGAMMARHQDEVCEFVASRCAVDDEDEDDEGGGGGDGRRVGNNGGRGDSTEDENMVSGPAAGDGMTTV